MFHGQALKLRNLDLFFGDCLDDGMLHPVGVKDVLQHEQPELADQFHRLDEVVVVVLLRLKESETFRVTDILTLRSAQARDRKPKPECWAQTF